MKYCEYIFELRFLENIEKIFIESGFTEKTKNEKELARIYASLLLLFNDDNKLFDLERVKKNIKYEEIKNVFWIIPSTFYDFIGIILLPLAKIVYDEIGKFSVTDFIKAFNECEIDFGDIVSLKDKYYIDSFNESLCRIIAYNIIYNLNKIQNEKDLRMDFINH